MRDSTGKGSASQLAESPQSGGGARAIKIALCAVLLTASAGAQSSVEWRIDTIAGLLEFGDGGPATAARLHAPSSVVLDGTGNLYIADRDNHRIRKVDPSGVISTIAGTGQPGFSGDRGPAVQAQLSSPTGVAVDSDSNLYIADADNNRIRKVDPTGTITTFAGTGEHRDGGFGEDIGDGGPATAARLVYPSGVATDAAGNLYIAGGNRIRKVDAAGAITTIAGSGHTGFSGDGGPAVQARLDSAVGVAVDSAGNVYITDTRNNRIRKVDSSGVITTIAGTRISGHAAFSGDGGPAVEAHLRRPSGVEIDDAGNLYIVDTHNNRIRKVDTSGIISTIAGSGVSGGGEFGGDGGPAVQAHLYDPLGVVRDSAGNLYIADTGNNRIRKVDSSGVISTFAGREENRDGAFGGDGGPATAALLAEPNGVEADSAGNLYIADKGNHRIRKVDSVGVISTFAGTGVNGFGGDGGPATAAQLSYPYDVATDGAGNLYIADAYNNRIRKVDYSGTITTIAGDGREGYGGDGGPATLARLDHPFGVTTDGVGNLYIADTRNSLIRKVNTSGTITTIAGRQRTPAESRLNVTFRGDGGPATAALLWSPNGLAVDDSGDIYIADTGNHRIRMVDYSGTITTIAGTGEPRFSGDRGPAVQAQLSHPSSVATDGAGNLYIADWHNNRIRMVNSSGVITSIAGSIGRRSSGEGGPASEAQINRPIDIAVDVAGNLYIAERDNHRVLSLTPLTEPAITAVLNAASFTHGIAPGSIASLFGKRLALETVSSGEQPLLPPALGGVRIEIIDSISEARAAPLLFVSSGQINFLTPAEDALGTGLLRLTRIDEEPVEFAITVSAVAPGLFSANGTGQGIGAISALRVAAAGSRSNPEVFRYDATALRLVGVPIDLGSEGDQVFLTLYGTGIRGAGGAESVRATIGGSEVPVVSAGAQDEFAGLDQVEIGPLPRTLAGRGEVNVIVTAAGITSNTVTIVIE